MSTCMDRLARDCTADASYASDAGPAPPPPLLTDEQCEAFDEMGEHLDCEPVKLITLEPFAWTPAVRKARAEFEAAMRDGELRGPPTIFSEM